MRSPSSLVLGLVALVVLLAGCNAPASPVSPASGTGRGIAWQPIDACQPKSAQELSVAAQNQADFDKLWQQACASATDGASAEPQLDFRTATALGVFWGQKNTGGYSTEVTNITEQADHVAVRVARDHPGKACGVAQVITYPGQLVQTEKLTKDVRFNFIDREVPC